MAYSVYRPRCKPLANSWTAVLYNINTFDANISTEHGCKINVQLVNHHTCRAPCNLDEISRQYSSKRYSECSKFPPSAFTHARGRFLKSVIDLQISSCDNSSQIFAI